MNINTGKVYETAETVEAAQSRGERLQPVSAEVAAIMRVKRVELLKLKQEARRRERERKATTTRARSRRRTAVQGASRKRNRR